MTAPLPAAPLAPDAPGRAPNGWRGATKAERSWVRKPIDAVQGRAFLWNLIPGLGLLRVGEWKAGAVTLALTAVLIAKFMSLPSMVFTAGYIGLSMFSRTIMAGRLLVDANPAFQEHCAAWQWRRRCARPDCARCGIAAASPTGLCPGCHAELEPHRFAYLTPQLRAADGFSFPADPEVAPFRVDDLRFHTSLGRSLTWTREKVVEARGHLERCFSHRHEQVLGAWGEPRDPEIVWLWVRSEGRMGDDTLLIEDAIHRARYERGRVVEIWATARTAFPEGRPSERSGKDRVDVPAKVRRAMAA